MKKHYRLRRLILVMMLVFTSGIIAHAQTWNEWFHQNKTQKKYLLAQIAALQIYIEQIKKGFSLCQQGLQFIHQVKNGEFALHSLFYSSLKQVNPQVVKYARVVDVIANQSYILSNYKQILAGARSSGQFTPAELSLFSDCFTNLVTEVGQTLDDLITVTSDGRLQMTDDERFKRIETLFAQSARQRDNLHRMETDLRSMALVRQKEAGELSGLSSLSGP